MSVATATHRLAKRAAASINVADEVEPTTNRDAAAGRCTVTFLAEGAALAKKQLRRCTSEIKRAPGRFASSSLGWSGCDGVRGAAVLADSTATRSAGKGWYMREEEGGCGRREGVEG